jgi:Uma2 family endonuclease
MAAELNLLSPEEYLARERLAEYKSEYVYGQVYAMAGGSPEHNLVAGNVHTALNIALRARPCLVFNSDMKVRLPNSLKFYYPDATVVCEKPRYADDERDALLNPLLLVEVLSPSTATYDRSKRFQHYQEIPSFREYLLVAQDEPLIERFVKQADGNLLYTKIAGLDQRLELVTLDCQLALQDIYAKVEWPISTIEATLLPR